LENATTQVYPAFLGIGRQVKNIAVIGGAGFIGSHVVDILVKQGQNVVIIDNLTSGSKKNINPGAEFIKYDITQPWGELAELFQNAWIDEVYHLAAEPYIPECYEFPEKFFQVNANGTMNVLLACREAKVKKILYWSSSEVYGTGEGLMDENFPLNPQSTYAVSKLAGDRLAFTLFKEQGIPTIILRQFNCYGPRETHEYVIPEIIFQLSQRKQLKLGNIKAKRDFTYVEDAAEMAIELMREGTPGEVYNLGFGRTYSIEYLAKTIGNLMGIIPIIEIDKKRLRPHDVEYLCCDNSKTFKKIKARPKTDIKTGLDKTIQWFYENNKRWGFEQ